MSINLLLIPLGAQKYPEGAQAIIVAAAKVWEESGRE